MRPWLRLLILFALVVAVRMNGASDLYQNADQTRSLAFTADVVLNGRWILPRDLAGEPARKPLLINWIGAVWPRWGIWDEWALKFPSLLWGLLALGFCYGAARRLASADPRVAEDPDAFGAAAAAVYLACPETVKHVYFFRPDMLNTAWLTGAWFFSLGMWNADRARARLHAVGYWLCIGLAALTKGTTAFIPLLYLPFAARVIGGSWKALLRTGWWWGLPLASGLFAIWAVPLVWQHGEFVRQVLIREETLSRIGSGPLWLWRALASSWKIPYWFCERFLPWSCFSVAALVLIRPKHWFRGGWGPAILWMLVIGVFFLPIEHRGGSYFMPAHPAAAALAAWCLSRGWPRRRLSLHALFRVAAAVAVALAVYKGYFGDDARRGVGDAVKDFARAARERVGSEPVAFANVTSNPVVVLMGRHQAGEASRETWRAARWRVIGVPEEELDAFMREQRPALVSRRLERDVDQGRGQYLCLVMNEPKISP